MAAPIISTLTSVNDSASSVVLSAANSARQGWIVFNDSVEALSVSFAATSSLTAFTVKIAAAGYFTMDIPIYTEVISGIWDANSTGAARITELT